MKRFLCLLISAVLILSLGFTADAKNFQTFGEWTVVFSPGDELAFTIDSSNVTYNSVTIPKKLDGVKVNALGPDALMNNTIITEVFIGDNIKSIGYYCFIDCTALERVILSSSVESIGLGAFTGTASLRSINLEDTSIDHVDKYLFSASGLEELALPDTCVALYENAFSGSKIKKLMVPDSVTEIADNAFDGCDDIVIYATKESYAIEYAVAKGIDYVITNPDYYEVEILLGDADGDNDVSILDATRIQRWLASYNDGNEEQVLLCGDTDRDGDVSILDATLIQRWLAQFTVPTPIGEVITIQVPVTE